MSHVKDSFDDAELTTFAMEIIKDLCTKPKVEPNDSFICELAEEIEREIIATIDPDSSVTDCSISYTDPSLYLHSTNPSSIAHDNPRSPAIVSRCQLSLNDSFNMSLPSIPDTIANNTTPEFMTISPNPRFYSPYHPPPLCLSKDMALYLPSSDISSCITPRRQRQAKVSTIPNFCELDDVVAITISKKHKKKTKESQTKKVHYRVQKVLSPLIIKGNGRDINARNRSRSTKQTMYKKKGGRERERKPRSKSAVIKGNEEKYNEYAVETPNGFIFVKSYD